MKNLKIEEMQDITGGGYWAWKNYQSSPHPEVIELCDDVFNYYGGNASQAAAGLSGTYVLNVCLQYVGGIGGGGGGGGD